MLLVAGRFSPLGAGGGAGGKKKGPRRRNVGTLVFGMI
jgi:hypothetical protein